MELINSGVDNVEIDMELQKVTVTGYVKLEEILEVARKTGKSVELWPYNSEHFGFAQAYGDDLYQFPDDPATFLHNEQPDDTIYRNHTHGYNDHHEQYTSQELPNLIMQSQTPFVAFSDENVNSCSIM